MDQLPGDQTTDKPESKFRSASDIVARHFADGLDELLSPRFLQGRYRKFESEHDPIYHTILACVQDESLVKAFVSYWAIAQTMATQSRFWLEDAIAEIVVHQCKYFGRNASHVYWQKTLGMGHFAAQTHVSEIGERELEHHQGRKPWRVLIQESAVNAAAFLVEEQERARLSANPSLVAYRNPEDRDESHFRTLANALTGPPTTEKWPALREAERQREIADELDGIAAEHAHGNGQTDEHGTGNIEIDMSRIVRPERFITQQLSGLAVPTVLDAAGRPEARWLLYLRWSDGRREQRDLTTSIDTPQGKLWLFPMPTDPPFHQPAGWHSTYRRDWLNDARAPAPAELFSRLCEHMAEFIDLPLETAAGTMGTLALWVILTYCYTAWDAVPYLFIGGPLGSGKSRTFDVLARLVFRPLQSSNLTGPALFRTLHNQGGTLLFDEAERLRQHTPDVDEIVSMLLAGYRRGGRATRLEPVGDGFRTVSFDVFGPKALACVTGLPPALASRSIPVMMFRARPDSPKPRLRVDANAEQWDAIRNDLHCLALEHGPTWLKLAQRANVCPEMSGRDYELWQPLLALAEWIERDGADGLLSIMQQHALANIEKHRDDLTSEADEILLRILAAKVRNHETPEAREILKAAQEQDAEFFKRWTPQGVGKAFGRYGITAKKYGGRRIYRAEVGDLHRIERSYGLDLGLPNPDGGSDRQAPE